MPDFARSVTGAAGYRVPADDPSFKGVHATEMIVLQERLNQAAARGSGGFRLDVEQMQALLPQWMELRDTLDWLRQRATDLGYVVPPAADESSVTQNRAALTHAELYARSVEDQYNYAAAYVDSLTKMIAKYQHRESSTSDVFTIMGTDL
ncbi:hypothetical protein AB0M80_02905 [Amycolatopsis sp. NPDC051045]|uniref:hypothetical protein n=1 Tax=Amycolatopsis sp. NPDC051045 TaxID=3156922 RepID=UPI003425A062